jgi:tight adherence protein C
VISAVALAWGLVAALPFAFAARTAQVTMRLRTIAVASPPRSTRASRATRAIRRAPLPAALGRIVDELRRRRRARRDDAVVRRELPVVVDLVAVAVAAGCTPFHAVEHAARFGPPRSGAALQAVPRMCARGRSFDEGLRDLAGAVPLLAPLAEVLRTSAKLGAPAAPALGRLAEEVRADSRRRAESRARTVPVRLCFPLVMCVLPAFALLTVVPVVFGGMHA